MTINMETRGRRYYEINERLAKQAKEMMSFSEYKTGSSTAEYIRLADEVYDIAEKAIEKRPEEADRIWFLASRYAQKCAEWVNRDNAIGTMCPSVMICGAGNFPTRKKEKQVTAWERHNAEFEKLQKYIDKIEAIGRGSEVIKAGDPYVIEKLEAKLEDAKALQEKMKAVNKAIRMKNVEAGDEKLKELGFDSAQIAELRKGDFCGRVGFQSFKLTNNNAEIHRLETRLRNIKAAKEAGDSEEDYGFCKLIRNATDMRIRFIFDGKPSVDVRDVLKGEGFRWSPKEKAWQRQLTCHGEWAAERAVEKLKEIFD
jgi:DNA repair exonuclease SbcCD nuclease subunit